LRAVDAIGVAAGARANDAMVCTAEALYLPDGGCFVPTAACRGPWNHRNQHAGPVAALLARAVHRAPADEPMHVTRLTVELLRPVPMEPATIETEIIRQSRRLSIVQVRMRVGDREVVRASGMRIRASDLALPAGICPEDTIVGQPGDGELAIVLGSGGGYNDLGVEIRFVEGGFQHMAPAVAWVRLRVPVVAGEDPSPTERAAAAADLGNGLSSVLRQRDWLYINTDLTLHLARPPMGTWVGMHSVTYPFCLGTGMAESALFDSSGRFGRSAQSLLIDVQR
jgi:hypothetical protein